MEPVCDQPKDRHRMNNAAWLLPAMALRLMQEGGGAVVYWWWWALIAILILLALWWAFFWRPGRGGWTRTDLGTRGWEGLSAEQRQALAALQERYVRGEITREQYEQMRRDIERGQGR